MIFKRCIPPTAAPISLLNIFYGFMGLFFGGNRKHVFDDEVRNYFSTQFVFTVSSGKAALTLILKGLSSKDHRKEVIIPAYTCYSVPAAIIRAGLKVKLCDIDPNTLDYDYEKLEQLVSNDTLCIITSNLFGISSNYAKLKTIKERKKVILIEDVAQSMGASYENHKLGTLGDVAFFSLGRGKNVTCGSGGIIITRSQPIAESIDTYYDGLEIQSVWIELRELLETFLMTLFLRPWLYCLPASMPFLNLGKTFYYTDFKIYKLSVVKLWLMAGWVSRLESSNSVRKANGHEITGADTGIPFLRIPYLCSNKSDAMHIKEEAAYKGLGIVGMYPTAICDIPEINEFFNINDYESARFVADRLVTVPSHQLLSAVDKRRIKQCLSKYNIHLAVSTNRA